MYENLGRNILYVEILEPKKRKILLKILNNSAVLNICCGQIHRTFVFKGYPEKYHLIKFFVFKNIFFKQKAFILRNVTKIFYGSV